MKEIISFKRCFVIVASFTFLLMLQVVRFRNFEIGVNQDENICKF